MEPVELQSPREGCTACPACLLLEILHQTYNGPLYAVSVTCIVLIPLRYQTAAGLDPLQAGARLILFSVASPIGASLAAAACKKTRVVPLYLMLFGQLLQIIGLVLVTTLTNTNDRDWPGLYGLQVCIGFGMELVVGIATLLTPAVVERKDLGKCGCLDSLCALRPFDYRRPPRHLPICSDDWGLSI
jgi:hypothetical protein